MKRLALFLAFFAYIGLRFAMAQTVQITGTVISSEDGQPLPGASVMVKGTNMGTTTNFEGKYTLSVPADAQTLVINFVGLKTQEVEIDGRTLVDVTLQPDVQALDEVVVTAMGIKREKKALGYSVGQVSSDEITNAHEANVVSALAGKVAGVQISNSSGMVGGSSRIVLRGTNSLSYNNQPLFVIDGIPYDNTEYDFTPGDEDQALFYGSTSNTGIDIDANQIESISVLKGAAASALYGSRAGNGVVMITTKGGKSKSRGPVIGYAGTIGWDQIRKPDYQTRYGQGNFGEYYDGETKKTSLIWGPRLDTTNLKTYDPFDFFRTGFTNQHAINIQSGSEKNSFFASYSRLYQEGTVPKNDLTRHNLMTKFTAELSSKLSLNAKMEYTHTVNNRLSEGNGQSSVMWTILNCPVTYNLNPGTDSTGEQRLFRTNRNNPYWLKDNTLYTDTRDRFNPSVGLDYKILDWIKLTALVGADNYNDIARFYENKGIYGTYPDGRIVETSRTQREYNSDIMLNIDKRITSDLSTTVLLGNNIYSTYLHTVSDQGNDFIIPNFFNMSNVTSYSATTEETLEKRTYAFYGQVTLDWKSILYLTVTGRNDWSSTLPSDNNSYFYPSVSLGYIFSEMLPQAKALLPFGKFRISYTIVANDAPVYATSTSYIKAAPGDGQRGTIEFPFNDQGSYIESNIKGNPFLKPEKVKEFETGLELKFLNNRIGLDFSYYNKRNEDQIFKAPIDVATGYVEQLVNAGKMKNTGIELLLNLVPVKLRDFEWEITTTYSKNKNKVLELAENVSSIRLAGFTSPGIFILKDQPYGVIWGSKYARNDQGEILIDDDPSSDTYGLPYTADDLGAIGNTSPDWMGSIRNTVTWKGLSVSALIDARIGGDLLNLDEYYSTDYGSSILTADREHPVVAQGVKESTGEANDIEVDPQTYYQYIGEIEEFLVQKADFIRLKEISLTYSLPSKVLGKTPIKAAKVSVVGRNLWLKTDKSFTGSDPDMSLYGSRNGQGFLSFNMPGTKGYYISLNLTF